MSRARADFTREAQDRWRYTRDNGTARPAEVITRATTEDTNPYSKALIALDEAGFRYTAEAEYAPGTSVRLFHPGDGFEKFTDQVIPSWAVHMPATQDVHRVWIPTLEEVLDEVYRRCGHEAEVTLEQHYYPAHGPNTERPLPMVSGQPCVVTIKDFAYGRGESFRAAATDALADLIRMTCPWCGDVSEGRSTHSRLDDGSECPGLGEDA